MTVAATSSATVRLVRLHLRSRHGLTAGAAILTTAVALRLALHWPWNTYGAYQLPLIAETGCAVAIATTTASRLGEPERAAGGRLARLRFGVPFGLTVLATLALTAAGAGTPLAGGPVELARNLIGVTGVGLLGAVLVGGALAWTGPAAYLVVGVYALYTRWHGPVLSSPLLWPARPADDLAAAACAVTVFVAGLAAVTFRGARDGRGDN